MKSMFQNLSSAVAADLERQPVNSVHLDKSTEQAEKTEKEGNGRKKKLELLKL